MASSPFTAAPAATGPARPSAAVPEGVDLVCGCIDIGSNTTRVLVADASDGTLRELLQRRAFTRIGKGLRAGGAIPREKIEEVARVVASHRELAEQVGARPLRTVATAAIRGAANRDEFVAALRDTGGVDVDILDGDEEARLAFLGATRTLGQTLAGIVGVVDVGGGSTEIAIGTVAGGVTWSASFALGSGHLADAYLHADPPAARELAAMRAHADGILEAIEVPQPDRAVAVGGSAASLRRLVGAVLEPETMQRALRVLSGGTVAEVSAEFALDPQRVRLLPAGILILDAASQRLGCPLLIGRGGLREGVLLELAAAA
ncbi:MAG: exopolyphosphatase / guanosine-5-triphosphate,3-diphosphate pyrophosphatase [Solirubrobacteraceae bacterium]|jgi:exopolyphosphatase/guanosine-5'-triphosphate,3'-diphosphate pyrophosphatase|nr:exopolyphosphatase / guanosine-5-triphosphate,3-diphosphate pyrophosphatase [Solirubrobacteraceae bacterium]